MELFLTLFNRFKLLSYIAKNYISDVRGSETDLCRCKIVWLWYSQKYNISEVSYYFLIFWCSIYHCCYLIEFYIYVLFLNFNIQHYRCLNHSNQTSLWNSLQQTLKTMDLFCYTGVLFPTTQGQSWDSKGICSFTNIHSI